MELKRERLLGADEGVSPPPSKRVNLEAGGVSPPASKRGGEEEGGRDCASPPQTVIPAGATNIKITSRGRFICLLLLYSEKISITDLFHHSHSRILDVSVYLFISEVFPNCNLHAIPFGIAYC